MKGGWKAAAALCVVLTLSAGCSFGPPDPDQAGEPPNLPPPSAPSAGPDSGGDQEVVTEVLAKDLEVPTAIAFLPDASALVTERSSGRILKVGPETGADGLKVTEVQRLAEVTAGGDGGLLGIAVSPAYKTDKTLYVYYSTDKDNRIGKLQLGGKLEPILAGIPHATSDNGGALAFGPDGFLYAGTGDGTPAGTLAPNPKSLGGKILRMTVAGKPAPGNPDKTSLVWASGFRNVLGLAWDKTKRLYATESDQKATGELNLIDPGKNYGWPKADGDSTDATLINPVVSWPTADSSCAGVAVLDRTVAAACLLGQRIWLVSTTEGGTVLGQPQPLLIGQFGRLRALVAAPDGSLWVSTSNQEDGANPGPDDDRLIRLVFSDGGAGRS